jgi:hypothetical protein
LLTSLFILQKLFNSLLYCTYKFSVIDSKLSNPSREVKASFREMLNVVSILVKLDKPFREVKDTFFWFLNSLKKLYF